LVAVGWPEGVSQWLLRRICGEWPNIRASGKVGGGNEVSWPPSHWLECESCGESVLNDFWALTYDERDVEQYKRFIEMLRLRKEGLYGPVIG